MKKLTTGQVAEALQISADTVMRLTESGELPCERLTPKSPRRILLNHLIEYAERNKLTLILPEQSN